MKRYPLAHKVVIPQGYRPSYDTDIRKTIKAERKRLAEAEAPKVVQVPPLVVDHVGAVAHTTLASGVVVLHNIPRRYRKD